MASEHPPARLLARALAVCVALAPMHVAWAADDGPSAEDRETARSLMKEGDRLLRADDPAQALRAYRAAHTIMNVPPTGMAVVRALTRLGKLVEARDVALQVLRLPAEEGEPPAFSRARDEAAAAARALEVRIAGIVVRAEGATVEIDGVTLSQETVGLVRKVDPGAHVVVVRAPGFKAATLEFTLSEGETREFAPQLAPLPAHPEPANAEAANARAEISPPVAHSPPPPADPPQPVREAGPREDSTTARSLMWGGASLAAAGLVVGSVTGVMAVRRSSDLRSTCPDAGCPPERQDDFDAAHSLATISNVAFALGIIGLGVGTYGYITYHAAPANHSSGTAVWRAIGPGTVALHGAF